MGRVASPKMNRQTSKKATEVEQKALAASTITRLTQKDLTVPQFLQDILEEAAGTKGKGNGKGQVQR